MTAMLTVSIWHNVTRDPEGRHACFGGFTPGVQMVQVFTYDTRATGRSPAGIAEDAFAAFHDAPAPTRPRHWPALPAAAPAVTVVPGKGDALPQVVLHPPKRHVAFDAVVTGSDPGRAVPGWTVVGYEVGAAARGPCLAGCGGPCPAPPLAAGGVRPVLSGR